jgi:hypothetical protein
VRDANGRFVKGHSGNPNGRPKGQAEYLRVLLGQVTMEQWRAIIDRAVSDAANGDRHARRWLSDYCLGQPPKELKLTGEIGITLDDWRQQAQGRLSEALTALAEDTNE